MEPSQIAEPRDRVGFVAYQGTLFFKDGSCSMERVVYYTSHVPSFPFLCAELLKSLMNTEPLVVPSLEGGLSSCKEVSRLDIKEVEPCLGCEEEQPNQLAHCDFGGCLYSEGEVEEVEAEQEEQREQVE